MEIQNLKLLANTDEDMRVISAHLQDSIVKTSDIANLKKNRIFLMQLNRFMWEDAEKGIFRDNKRIRSAFKINEVRYVKSKNFNHKEKKTLEFLTININQDNEKN